MAVSTREFTQMARRLDRLGSGVLGDAMERGASAVVPELARIAQAEAKSLLPHRGGLAARVAKTNITTKVSSNPRHPNVRIIAQPSAVQNPRAINRGRVRHLTFGRVPWISQNVRADWFSGPMSRGAPLIRASVERAVSAEIEKRV